jgi:hypothetical protein
MIIRKKTGPDRDVPAFQCPLVKRSVRKRTVPCLSAKNLKFHETLEFVFQLLRLMRDESVSHEAQS